MKIIIGFVFCLSFLIDGSFDSINDCKSKILFEKQLKIIEDYTVFDSSDNSVRRMGAVHFLEMVTDISSESDANFFGKMNPTRKDFILWSTWFKEHKDSLCLNGYRSLIDSAEKRVFYNNDENMNK